MNVYTIEQAIIDSEIAKAESLRAKADSKESMAKSELTQTEA